ncbi:MAG TPA: DUF2892 domain-containing protein [Flavipsychrobacter sp.]|jgi:Na+/H+ antiporter NhaA|nr:DUF2892 domain-containing protein [Flavipsychrobacter sp.]
MKKNVGTIDRYIRILFAIVVVILYYTKQIEGTTAIVAGIVAMIMLATSFLNFCPIYAILGINTCKTKH